MDISVLVIFYTRHSTLSEVFNVLKQVKPKRLFLWQDGSKNNTEEELNNINKCREIFENINWDCQVYKNYHNNNFGCDPSTYYAQKWAFSLTDKCIVLEDDQVPSLSFFQFCSELLDKYENDSRISHINGHNYLSSCDWCPYDYLFSYNGSGAWASWKRVVDAWDDTYGFLENKYLIKNIKKTYGKIANRWIRVATQHKNSGIKYWESILGMNAIINNQLAIIPKQNLVKNIGLTKESTHSLDSIDLIPKSQRYVFINEPCEIKFPLQHPDFIIVDRKYQKKMSKINCPSLIRRFVQKISLALLLVRKGKFKLLFKKIGRKICFRK